MNKPAYQPGSVQLLDIEIPEAGQLIALSEGIYWCQMPLPMALDHINLYVLEEEDGWCIVDTGMHLPDTVKLWEKIFAKYFQHKPVIRVIATHMHPDHIGNAGWLCEHWRCPLYMSEVEYFVSRSYTQKQSLAWQSEAFYREAGLGDDYIDYVQNRIGFSQIVSPMPAAYRRLIEGASIKIGSNDWSIVISRGHSFAHVCLHCEALGILIAGDQVLPKISPNVSVYASEPEGSPLSDWLASLQALKAIPANTLVLPAHNRAFYGLHERLDELTAHHEQQCQKLLHACQTPQKPIDLLQTLFGRKLGLGDMSLAVGECLAHLRLLLDRGDMQKNVHNGVAFYQSLKKADINMFENANEPRFTRV